jgi:hypothetical protein
MTCGSAWSAPSVFVAASRSANAIAAALFMPTSSASVASLRTIASRKVTSS